jgi:hypothetical protein
MLGFGLRLTLRSGREALVRLLLTTIAVAAGVAVLLCVFADFNAFEASNKRPAWEQTVGATVGTAAALPKSGAELWYYSNDSYQGKTIERLDVASLGPGAPVPPGVAQLPGPGTYYVSPALAALLKSVPADELGERFPGAQAGVIADEGLTGPDELAIYIGYSPAQLAPLPHTMVVGQIANGPQTSVWTNYFRYAFGVGALAFMFPILILIGTATRLAAARREQRFAALRLVGATSRQIGVLAAVDALAGALLGTLAGIGAFLGIRPALADYAVIGTRYFGYTVTPTAAGYLGVLIAVPLLSALAAVLSLRRVRISPLGVTRRTTPPPPSAWRLLPLGLGLLLFGAGIAMTSSESIGTAAYPGLLVIMIGLVVGGPWLTAWAARMLARVRGTAAALLASRRLTDNPRVAFRSVSGLVLAVFLGTLLAGLMPAINATTATPNADALQNVLLDDFTLSCASQSSCNGPSTPLNEIPAQQFLGLTPTDSALLVQQLHSRFPDAAVLPIYSQLTAAELTRVEQLPVAQGGGEPGPGLGIVSCAALTGFPSLGTCPAGAAAIATDTSSLTMSDNPLYSTRPIVTARTKTASADVTGLSLNALLVRPSGPAELERVRTYLAVQTGGSASASAPKTFGEQIQSRLNVSNVVQRMVSIAVVLTLIVAGASLAVAIGGGLVERRRPFALLRVSGTGIGTLYRVVLLESVLPLVTATVLAAGTAYLLAYLAVAKMAPAGTAVPRPSAAYYATTGGGLLAAVVVVLAVLPVLGRLTGPEDARFE